MNEQEARTRPEDELGCAGFFGFGSGWMVEKQGIPADRAWYCNTCPTKSACWDAHRLRVQAFFPELTATFEEMAKALKGPALVKRWLDEFGKADPYTTVMLGNFQDGIAVGAGEQPANRGAYTIRVADGKIARLEA